MVSQHAVDLLARILANPVFLSALPAWLLAQILKSIIMFFRNRPRTAKEIILNIFWTTGGMPSSHSAVVAALATSAGSSEGPDSTSVLRDAFLRVLTFRDALGGTALGGCAGKGSEPAHPRPVRALFPPRKPVKEIHGHTMSEVFVGALLGFFIALAYCTL